jgi:hypothetical protein
MTPVAQKKVVLGADGFPAGECGFGAGGESSATREETADMGWGGATLEGSGDKLKEPLKNSALPAPYRLIAES